MASSIEEQQAELRARFTHNLRVSRVVKGISQEELARLAGVHRTFVSDVERGVRNLSIDNIARLAHALALDPSELLKPVDSNAENVSKSLAKGPKRRKEPL